MWLVFVGGIHEHETCGTLRVIGSEHADVETRDGGPDEHHRSANSAADEEFGQLARDAACCPRRRAAIAVTHTCPVVGADTRESSNIRLDEAPVSTRAAESRVEDDSRRAVPGAPQMQPVPSDVDEMSGRRSRRQLLSSRKPLVRGAGECGNDKERAQHDENAHRPAPHVDTPVKSCAQPAHSRDEWISNLHWADQSVNLRGRERTNRSIPLVRLLSAVAAFVDVRY